MIKIVLFDFGGVLTEGGKLGSIRVMFAKAYGVPPEVVNLDESVGQAFCGLISDAAFVEAINRINPQLPPVTTGLFADDADIFDKSEPVYGLAARLRANGIGTGIFSNVFSLSADRLQSGGYYEGFGPLFLSCKMHLQKPDKEMYDRVLAELKCDPATVAFVDDKEVCLEPARAIGMHTVLAVSPSQIVNDVESLVREQNGLRL